MAFYSFQNLHEAYNLMRDFATQAPSQHCLNSWFPTGPGLYLSKHKRCLIILDLILQEIYFYSEFQWVGQKNLLAQFEILEVEELF